MLKDTGEVRTLFEGQGYITGGDTAMAVFLASRLNKPLLVEGPVGAGKTELARVWAASCGMELHRLQCYEGLDESRALYEWEYSKQLLYTQILRDRLGEMISATEGIQGAVARLSAEKSLFFSMEFLEPRPILRAILSEKPALLLIDEIDRADAEFEAFLLEVLSDMAVTIPELGTIKARGTPAIVLTSNSTREISDALRRRCLHLSLGYPDPEREARIIESRVPGIRADLCAKIVAFVGSLRKAGLSRPPSVGEAIDWARSLVLLSARDLDETLVRETLGLLVKQPGDAGMVEAGIASLIGSREG
jgi:MoxR-like ATPase